ncbi:class I SAM-dependent methyltransferase [Gracilibacillus sp. YIM 98692]|uniref:tRNA (adenine(22)-N(1))-methyltransferase n=1 Tax=Gracilibacillus sp. YIM 98692 TaxID=2663532 RepID=UPI0013D08EBD|nr:class I SAM-dependent methyltransferase [Gracilibacillus sp. YIM 98692]
MLSKRLKNVASYVKSPIKLADIGSDHAYLPCYICELHGDAIAIAGEVNQGPFERALSTVKEHGLSDRISVRKGNGLDVIQQGEVNQIVIAGMGGKLIRQILVEGNKKLLGVKRLILQPNLDAHLIRRWLQENNYQVVAEEMIEEDGYIYEIIVSDYVEISPKYTKKEILFGPKLLEQKNKAFMNKWQWEKDKRIRLIKEIQKASKIPVDKLEEMKRELKQIEEVLQE